MGQLDADGRTVLVNEVDDRLQGLDLAVLPQAEIGGADAPARVDRRALGEDQAGAAQRELSEVNEMPGRGVTGVGGMLAHRRDHDAVLQLQVPKLERLEEDGFMRCHVGDLRVRE